MLLKPKTKFCHKLMLTLLRLYNDFKYHKLPKILCKNVATYSVLANRYCLGHFANLILLCYITYLRSVECSKECVSSTVKANTDYQCTIMILKTPHHITPFLSLSQLDSPQTVSHILCYCVTTWPCKTNRLTQNFEVTWGVHPAQLPVDLGRTQVSVTNLAAHQILDLEKRKERNKIFVFGT